MKKALAESEGSLRPDYSKLAQAFNWSGLRYSDAPEAKPSSARNTSQKSTNVLRMRMSMSQPIETVIIDDSILFFRL